MDLSWATAIKALSPKHWTTREIPGLLFIRYQAYEKSINRFRQTCLSKNQQAEFWDGPWKSCSLVYTAVCTHLPLSVGLRIWQMSVLWLGKGDGIVTLNCYIKPSLPSLYGLYYLAHHSSVYGILQAGVGGHFFLQGIFPGDLSWSRDWTTSLTHPALAGRFFTTRAIWEATTCAGKDLC